MAPQRVNGCQVSRPLLVGNSARPLGDKKRPDSDHTHDWTIAVRGVDGEDLTPWVKKVVFKLHDTYANSTRVIEKAPYEVTETGWGEFDVMIRIYFAPESHEKSIVYYHHLKLHPYGPDAEAQKAAGAEVNSWQYEEIVFNEPTQAFFDILTHAPIGAGAGIPNHAAAGKSPYSLQAEQDEYERLDVAHKKVLRMIKIYKDKLSAIEKK